jgi:DNA-binding CsgD family transcriptional regulator
MGMRHQSSLIERDDELAALRSVLARAAGGIGACVVLEGAPGIGKTALLRTLGDEAQACGTNVLRARGGELERDFPHGVVRQLLERPGGSPPLTGASALAAPALGLREAGSASGVAEADFAVTHGLYWLVASLAEAAPLAIVVDDLQWVDEPSLRFLVYLTQRLAGLPVAIAAATRTREAREHPLVAKLLAVPEVRVVRPRELTPAGSGAWLRRALGEDASPSFEAACHTASGGNPFLLGELFEALRADGIAADEEGARRIPSLSPRAVSHSVLLRLVQLPPDATALARAVVTLGEAAELPRAAALAGIAGERASELADALVDAHVLADERPLAFVHPIVGEAIRGDMRTGEAAGLHARAARLLDDEGRPPDRLVQHLMLSEAVGDPWVVRTLRAAAALASSRGAVDAARRALARALAEGVAENRPALLLELGEAEWLSGQAAEGIEHLRGALSTTADDELASRAALALARALASIGELAAATAVLRDVPVDASGAPTAWAKRIEAELATYAMLSGVDVDLAAERLERFADLPGDDVGDLLVLCSLAVIRIHTRTAPDAVQAARRGLAGDRLLRAGEASSFPYLGATVALCLADAHDEARAQLDGGLAHARARGSSVAFSYACGTYATLAWMVGDVRLCEEMAREAIEPGIPSGFAHPVLHTYLALALIERGDLDGADTAVEQIGGGQNPLFVQSAHALCALARLRREQGRVEEALAFVRELGRRPTEAQTQTPHPPWRLEAAESLLALGDAAAAIELLDEQAAMARRWGTPSGIGPVERMLALAAPPEHRIALLTRAEATLAASPARLEHARALVDLGGALAAAGRRDEGRAALRQGAEQAADCGASVLQRDAHEALVASGARPQRERFTGVDSLTASERGIVEMAVTGMSNAEIAQARFVTTSTVEKHLSHAYEKLGIDSREQLAGALAGVSFRS